MSNLTNRSNLTQVQGTTTQYTLSPVLVGPSWKQLSVGGSHVIAIRSNDTLWAWGNNSSGQLGDKTYITRSSPVLIGGVYTWKSASAGGSHSLAVRNDGIMFAWGDNSTGQLGNNGVPYSNIWKQISSIWSHTLLIRNDDTLWAVGVNTNGELGDGTVTTRPSPVQIGTSKYIAISAGPGMSYAITNDNRLFAWGFNGTGELGQGNVIARSSPVQIAGSWTQVTCSASEWYANTTWPPHAAAINTQGQLFTWGSNVVGQLGDNTGVSRSSPVQVAGGLSFANVSAGSSFTLGITTDKTLWGWGTNVYAQQGNPNPADRSSPFQISAMPMWEKVTAGRDYGAGVTTSGALWAWGFNTNGQLGDGTNVTKYTLTQIFQNGIKDVNAHTLSAAVGILTTDNRLLMSGLNSNGQLGDGTTINRSSFTQVGNDNDWSSIVRGNNGSLGLKTDGRLFGWGQDSTYQVYFGITDGTAGGRRSSPVQTGAVSQSVSPVQVGTSSWTQVSAGADHSLAIRSDKTLWAFGNNNVGQLIATGFNSASSPVQVGTSSYSQISAGKSFSLSITTDGALFAAGNNTYGQAGAPSVSTTYSWTKVAATMFHTLAIRNDGLLFAWGANNRGQLGDGTTLARSSPVQIGTNSWISVAANALNTYNSNDNSFSLAVRLDGTVWAWGYNTQGQLGQNDLVNRSSPVQVGSFSGITKVAAGWQNGLAVGSNGLWTWGPNASGQLGDSTTIAKSSPVQISTFSFTQIAAGWNSMVAIRNDGILFAWGGGGALGLNDTLNRSVITQVGTSSWTNVFARSGGTEAILDTYWAIRSDGKLFGWGYNGTYAIGDSTSVNRSSPVQVGAYNWTSIASTTNTTPATTTFGTQSDGSVWAWGLKNSAFGVDNATTTFTHSWIQVSSGASHSMFLRGDNTLWGTGANTLGPIGDNSTVNRSSPVQVGTSAWKAVSAGGAFTLGLDSNNILWSWGNNTAGQLGLGGSEYRSSPVQVYATSITSWNSISAGYSHSMAIDTLGGLYSWGSNSYKQLGQVTPIYNNALSWSIVNAGLITTAFIRSDGILFTVGLNNYGSVGDNTVIARSSPVQIGTNSWINALPSQQDGGREMILALRSDGKLFTWGQSLNGTLGDGTTVAKSSPTQIGNSSWTYIATAGNAAFAIRADSTLWAWGYNQSGAFGVPTINPRYSSPIQIGTTTYSKIATTKDYNATQTFGLAIDSLGKLFAWGSNSSGALGQGAPIVPRWSYTAIGNDGNTFAIATDGTLWGWGLSPSVTLQNNDTAGAAGKSSPVQLGLFGGTLTEYIKFSKVAPGYQHGYAIATDGALYGWGQPPQNTSVNYGNNEAIAPTLTTYSWSQVSTNNLYALAIRSDGKLFAWGNNGTSQLGDGSATNRSAPVQIGNSSWSQVKAGGGTSIGIDAAGRLFTWGSGTDGKLGDNSTAPRNSPVWIMTPYSWSQVAGNSEMFAIRQDGLLFGWGLNQFGSLGQNDTIARSSPVQIASHKVKQVFTSNGGNGATGYMFMIRDDNILFGCGTNDNGQLGDGATINRSSPVQIGTSSWSMVSGNFVTTAIDVAGRLFTWGGYSSTSETGLISLGTSKSWTNVSLGSGNAGVDYLGRLWTWGDNSYGLLGDNTTVIKSSPVQVPGSWSQVSVGATHMAAISSTGSMWTWGRNFYGQLGGNTVIDRSSPVQISSDLFTKVKTGAAFTAAINSQGQLFLWGENSWGMMGDGTTASRSNPTQLGIGFSWTDMSLGGSHVVALRADNTLWVWGNNTNGSVGDGTTIHRSSPVQLAGSWSQVAVGGAGSTYAVNMNGYLYSWGLNNYGQLGDGTTINRSSPVQISAGYPGTVQLSGTSQYLNTTNINFSTSNFTVEGWYYFTVAPSSSTALWGQSNGTGSVPKIIFNATSTNLNVQTSAGVIANVAHGGLPLNTWIHLAVVRTGIGANQIIMYKNGIALNTTSTAVSDLSGITSNFYIGYGGETGFATHGGNISNFRIVMDVAVYTGNFTVPTSPLSLSQSTGTNISAVTTSQTYLLTCNNPGYADMSIYRRYITNTATIFSPLSPFSYGWTRIIGAYTSVFAKATDNTLWAWGDNASGQLAMNDSAIPRSSPVQIAGFSSYITNLNSHDFIHNATLASGMGVLTNSDLLLWGANSFGQLGDNTTISKSNPVQIGGDKLRSSPVQVGSMSWTAISSGNNTILGVAQGKLYGWGNNTYGQLGAGDRAGRGIPTLLSNNSYSVVVCGINPNNYLIDSSGKLYSIGINTNGGLGFNSTINRSSPVQVPATGAEMSKLLNGSSFTQVTTYLHTAAIKTDGTLWMWGYNNYGQLGDGTTISKYSPIQVPGSYSQIAINESTTVALKTDGTLWAWGDNTYGQLADGSSISRSSPVQLVAGSSFTQIAANYRSVYAIKPNFTLWSWGYNLNGQLGDSTTVGRSSPVQMTGAGTSSWTQLSAQGQAIIMQSTNGILYGTGLNTNGQLGDNSVTSRSAPVQLAGVLGFSSVFVLPANNSYDNNALNARTAIIGDKLFAWGYNANGQLGDNTTTGTSSAISIASTLPFIQSPLQIGTSSWSQVSAGADHVAAITSNGTMFTWGGASYGQLGAGADYLSISIAASYSGDSAPAYAGYVRSDGTLWFSGQNALGNFGNGGTVATSLLTQTGTAEWKQVTVGATGYGGTTIALKLNGSLWFAGSGTLGASGLGTNTSYSSFVMVGTQVGMHRYTWTTIAQSNATGYAINTLGELWSWGDGGNGKLGQTLGSPGKIASAVSWKAVYGAPYAQSVFATKVDGTLWAWGSNSSSQLGDGTGASRSSPVQIPGSWIMVSMTSNYVSGSLTTYGIKADNTMWAWGSGTNGVLGDNTVASKNSPVQIGAAQATSWLAVQGNTGGATALSSDGTLWYWGASDGAGTDWYASTVSRSQPTQLSTTTLFNNRTNWENYYSAKTWIAKTGQVYAWGWNGTGQFGDNTTVARSSPIQIGTGLNSASYLLTNIDGSWSQVSAGTSNTVATRTNGSVWGWGLNALGGLGDNTSISRSSPVQVALSNIYWAKISSNAGEHVAGIKSDGSLWTWGRNDYGQLGFSNTIYRSSPVQLGTSSWTQVFANARATHAIDSTGRLFAWGNNVFGQLGLNDTVFRSSPVQVGALTTWAQISGGSQSAISNQEFTTAINTAGQLFTWGCNSQGNLGDNATVNRSSPVQIMTTSSFTLVSSSNFHTMALSINNGLYLFGLNQYGQLGDNTTANRSSPVQIGSTSKWTNVAAGTITSAAIDITGRLFTWGFGSAGLGDNTTADRSSPVQVGNSTWAYLYTNGYGFAAIPPGSAKTLYVWGNNNVGQMGNNSTVDLSSITLMDNSTGWNLITGGTVGALTTGVTLGIRDGKLFSWGYNALGQLGQNDTVSRSSPAQLGTYSSWNQVSTFFNHTHMIRSDNQLFSTGDNTYGQLAAGPGNIAGWSYRSSPVQVGSSYITLNALPTKLDNNSYSQISAGEYQSMAIRNDSTLWGWGLNNFNVVSDANTPKWSKVFGGGYYGGLLSNFGELYLWGVNTYGVLGDNTITSRPGPRKLDNNSWTMVAFGSSYSVAIRADGTLWTWGQNTYGALGSGNTTDRSSPVQIGTASNWTQTTAGSYSTFALNTLGQLFAWGYNASGQLGDGTTVSKSSPVQIAGSWMTLGAAADGSQTFGAIKPDYTLWMWGYAQQGQMGINDISAKSSPVQVPGSWTQLMTPYQVLAIRTDNSLWGWGDNTYGQLGQTNTVARSSPVQVTVFNYKQIAGSQFHTVLLRSDDTAWTMGLNNNGQLGLNDTTNRSSPTQVGTSKFTFISGNSLGSRFIFHDNSVAGSGQYPGNESVTNQSSLAFVDTSFTQLASNPISFASSPVQVNGSWTSVSTNYKHAMAIKLDGTLWGWGSNSEGQLGYITPTTIASLKVSAYTTSDGKLWSWGYNSTVGDTTTINRSSPVQIISGTTTNSWSQVTTAYYAAAPTSSNAFKLAIDTSGRMFAWGYNNYGQLGTNNTTNFERPIQVGHTRWIDVAEGAALKEDNTLWTWGWNVNGDLGDGSTISRSSPIQVGNSSWTMVGNSHAIRLDGTLWGWGTNASFGTIGDGTTVNRSSPVQIGLLTNWKFLSRNGKFAINSLGQLFGWGQGGAANLGDNSTAYRSSPVQIGAAISFVYVDSAGPKTTALDNLGRLYAWGEGSAGQVGDGTTISRSSPVQIGNSSWIMMASSSNATLAIRLDRTLWAWGDNTNGEIGDGTTINRSSPVQVGTDTWQSIYAAANSIYGVRNNQVYVWGRSNTGQLGDNSTVSRSSPVQISTSNIPIKVVGANPAIHVLTQTGRLIAWGGSNLNGSLGLGDVIARSSPVQVGTTGMSWTQISNGMLFSAAIKDDSTLWMWGDNSYGTLGNNDTFTRSRPVQIAGSWNQVTVKGLSTAGYTFGIKSDKTLWSWGYSGNGVLGLNDALTSRSSPVQIGNSSWNFVTGGGIGSAGGIDVDGRLYMWGGLAGNGIGDNTTIYRSSPVQIMAGRSFTQLAINESVAMAIDTNGTLWGWGGNSTGMIGDNTVISRSSPVQIGTSSWSMISADGGIVVGVVNTGYQQVLYGWGVPSAAGWLGDGTTVNKSSPTQISTIYSTRNDIFYSSPVQVGVGNSWLQVSTGAYHTIALRNDYTVWSWGMNYAGQIGTNDTIYRSSPTQVSTSSWTTINAGGDVLSFGQTFGILSNGLLYAWGQNNFGQLGDTSTVLRSAPLQVASGTMGTSPIYPINLTSTRGLSYTQVGYGSSYAIAIKSNSTLFAWGDNTYGQLGQLNTISSVSLLSIGGTNMPYTVGANKIGNSSWSQISAGATHALALDSTNKMYGWGNFAGNPTTSTTSWKTVKTGYVNLAIKPDDTLWGWGYNIYGQLGDNTTINKSSPVQIGLDTGWVDIQSSVNLSAAIKSDSRLFVWGENTNGRLGDGTTISKSSPVQIPGSWSQVALGFQNSFGQKVDGTWWGWGTNSLGIIGDNTTISRSSPVQISSNWQKISVGYDHAIGIMYDGTMWAWGNNTYGALGLNDTIARSAPIQIGGSRWTSVTGGNSFTVALRADGTLWSWGRNDSGECGLSDLVHRSSPTQIGTSFWTSVTTANFSSASFASDVNGVIYGWGVNGLGQLGDNTSLIKSSPVVIGAGLSFKQVFAGATAGAIDLDNNLYLWGYGGVGGMMNISAGNVSSPVLVTYGLNNKTSIPVQIATGSWTHVNAGTDFSLAIDTNNSLYFWGKNELHQSGTSSPARLISSPIQIGSGSNDSGAGAGTAGYIKNI